MFYVVSNNIIKFEKTKPSKDRFQHGALYYINVVYIVIVLTHIVHFGGFYGGILHNRNNSR